MQRRCLGAMRRCAFRTDATKGDAAIGQAPVGIVGAQRQAIFGARREHPVRLAHPARHQVVDHDAEIGFSAIEHDWRRAAGS